MALPGDFSLSGLSIAYVFTFDLPVGIAHWLGAEALSRLEVLCNALYQTADNSFVERGNSSADILKAYRDEMYNVRFKRTALGQRQTVLLQLRPLACLGLADSASQVIRADEQVTVDVTCTLNEMGVGSLVLWMDLIPNILFDLKALYKLRDASLISTEVDYTLGIHPRQYRIDGRRSLVDLARFLVIALFCQLRSDRTAEKVRRAITTSDLGGLHGQLCRKTSVSLQPSPQIDSYPIFFSDLANTAASHKEIDEWLRTHTKELRGLLTGDKNWSMKRDDIAKEFLDSHSFSTRDSIWWYSHSNGSIKIYSKEMRTPIVVSKVLLVFELEYLLLMKHFAYRIIRNLNAITAAAGRPIPLRHVTSVRDQEMRRLDEYYNLDVLQKDTTAKRLKRFYDMFRIGEVVAIATQKLESLNILLSTEFQNAAMRRTLALSIIFGIFGAGKLLFDVLKAYNESALEALNFRTQVGITITGMILVALIIIEVFGQPRIR